MIMMAAAEGGLTPPRPQHIHSHTIHFVCVCVIFQSSKNMRKSNIKHVKHFILKTGSF